MSISLKLKLSGTAIAASTALLVLCASGPAQALPGDIGAADFLGTAQPFTVLGGAAVTNTGPSILPGRLGVSPGSSTTGFPPGLVGGSTHTTDAVAISAQSAITVAANALVAVDDYNIGPADMDGLVFLAGSYSSPSTLLNNGTITLQGDADDIFIFTAVSALTTGGGSTILFSGDVQECNVFWRLGSAATLGAGSHMVGTVIAQSAVSAVTGATIAGKLFAQVEAVSLQSNVFTDATCDTSGGNGDLWGAGETPSEGPDANEPIVNPPTGPVLPIPEIDEETGPEGGGGSGSGSAGPTTTALASTGSAPMGGLLAGAGLLGVGFALMAVWRARSVRRSATHD